VPARPRARACVTVYRLRGRARARVRDDGANIFFRFAVSAPILVRLSGMRTNRKGSTNEAAPLLTVHVSADTRDHWLSEIGTAFDLSNEIASGYAADDDAPSLADLHDSAAYQHGGALTEITRRAQHESRGYERDRYYVGESADEARTMRAIVAASHENPSAEQRAWVCREEIERHGVCAHCEAAFAASLPKPAGFAPFALVSVGEDGGFTTKH